MKRNNRRLSLLLTYSVLLAVWPNNVESSKKMAKATAKFTSNIYKVLKYTYHDNIAFSPTILSASLEMLRQGANGSTEAEIQKVLGFNKVKPAAINDMFLEFVQALPEIDEVTFESTRRLYMPYTHKVWTAYKDQLKDEFPDLAEPVKVMDFGRSADAAKKINDWMRKETHGKITKVVSSDHFNSNTKLVLVSGVYFTGEWEYSFRSRESKNELFYVNDTHYSDAVMMHRIGRTKYIDLPELGATAVSIPYAGDKLSLVIILPNERFGLPEVEYRLEYSKNEKNYSFTAIPSRMKKANVDLFIPKFKIESSLELNNRGSHLQRIGLSQTVSQRTLPDFTKMSPQPGLYLDQIIHKTVIDVHEDGLQSSPKLTKLKQGEKYITFRADHPFLAYVYDKETKSVLLVAKKIT